MILTQVIYFISFLICLAIYKIWGMTGMYWLLAFIATVAILFRLITGKDINDP